MTTTKDLAAMIEDVIRDAMRNVRKTFIGNVTYRLAEDLDAPDLAAKIAESVQGRVAVPDDTSGIVKDLLDEHHAALAEPFNEGMKRAEVLINAAIEIDTLRRAAAPQPPAASADNQAVDRFAAMMKEKLAIKAEQGRGGWNDPEQCKVEYLSQLLHEHVAKGDPIDVANLAMMLCLRGSHIQPAASAGEPCDHECTLRPDIQDQELRCDKCGAPLHISATPPVASAEPTEREPGTGWTLSDEAKADIRAIDERIASPKFRDALPPAPEPTQPAGEHGELVACLRLDPSYRQILTAADAIVSLTAERDKAQKLADDWQSSAFNYKDERDKLRELLTKVYDKLKAALATKEG